ncbi:hypothetical protein ET475_07245 [Microbacterium protaetiae]|uniref:ESX-1 secretion-associated protein n=1 Tax=Microbacterium protaetiae TaxID=2509458 RepID=A0A4P6EC62_9MICO|nr:hypothetical protein [Microbacterium protaetiae]QAY59805.1 hypothetical protein ET475_07245 [Microbacterium protaetiae]
MTVAWDFDVLREQARRVDQIGDDVGEAAAAARSLHLSGGAFGVLCSFLVPPGVAVTSAAAEMIDASEALMQRTGTQLRGLAEDGEEFERLVVAGVKTLDGELE